MCDPEYVKQLASCDFIKRHENLVMIGNPGTGKTHLMTALGVKACLLGWKVIFCNATTLATELCLKPMMITSCARWKKL